MAQVVLSYARETKDFVGKLALALKARGLDVWYDHDLLPGEDYSNKIDEQIITAAAVLVVWSQPACKSKWVKAEASRANDYDKLIQVICEPCALPLPFNSLNYVDLTAWSGGSASPEISKIVAAAGTQIDRKKTERENSVPDESADEDLSEVRRILDEEARIQVVKLIAQGEISKIYFGRAGTRLVAIKALRGDRLSSDDRKELSKEIELSSYLQHPTFLRIYQILFPDPRCFIVADFFEGQTVAQKLRQGSKFSVDDVIGIIQQLSAAIAEAHARGMQYLRITPSDILVRTSKIFDRQVARIAPINLKYFIEYRRMDQEVQWHDESAPFTAPELWSDPSWLDESADARLDEEWVRSLHQKANQFALGMVAWTMLEGKIPVAIAKRGFALTKIKTFLDASERFPELVLGSPWRANARALAGIVARMVSADPRQRWEDMKEVNVLMSALAADHAARALQDTVKTVYNRICRGQLGFYDRFYTNLFRRASPLREKFPSDMARQHKMLDFALGQMLNYSQQQSDPTTLSQFVELHAQLKLSADDFIHFGEALVETFDVELKCAPERYRAMAALEIIIWPAIHYLIQKCVEPNRAELGASSA